LGVGIIAGEFRHDGMSDVSRLASRRQCRHGARGYRDRRDGLSADA
jgi:hypothetical protein